MKRNRFIFIGRTGAGKSTLINYLSGKDECKTDKYRPCTKNPKEVSIQLQGNTYEFVDTPGLGESGDELDSLYIDFISQYLTDEKTTPAFVFKSDDSRLRSEDYSLLKLLANRFGARVFEDCTLFLTFAANLGEEYVRKATTRTKMITEAIYQIQNGLNQDIFNGFRYVKLLDSKCSTFMDVSMPKAPTPVVPEVFFALSSWTDDHSKLAKKLNLDTNITEKLIESFLYQEGFEQLPYYVRDLGNIANKIAQYPFHNSLVDPLFPLSMKEEHSLQNQSDATLPSKPNSIYEVAEILIKNNISESSFSINNGILKVQTTMAHRQFINREEYANCARVDACCFKDDSGQFTFFALFKKTNHPYTDDGKPDEVKIIEEAENAPNICHITLDSIVDFIKVIKFPSYFLGVGEDSMEKGIIESLHDEEEWENITIVF